ncbi:MAG: hypothetical protein QM538_07235 [Methylacidiphilales bacterium]|nr:hypothetical protein [Candidatus Methylacidiphilales bacterium]
METINFIQYYLERFWRNYGIGGMLFALSGIILTISVAIWILKGGGYLYQTYQSSQVAPPKTIEDINTERISYFESLLPRYDQTPIQLERVEQLSKKNQLIILSSEYYASDRKGSYYSSLIISMTLRGSSKQLHNFINQFLIKTPYASIRTVQFRKKSVRGDSIEAIIEYELFYKA